MPMNHIYADRGYRFAVLGKHTGFQNYGMEK